MATDRKVTVDSLLAMKRGGTKIVAVTSYDYPTALIADRIGIDVLLVGDSGGMVVLGYETTIPVRMQEMLTFCKAASRAAKRALIVADMPYASYDRASDAVKNANKFVKEGGAGAVKVEGGSQIVTIVKSIVGAGIPVMGHIGLTPQKVLSRSDYKLQGKNVTDVQKLIEDAKALEMAGAFAIVLEFMTVEATKAVTKNLKVPTIGIGSGPFCDGQVLVLHDLLGLYDKFTPRFVRKYADLSTEIGRALREYKEDVRKGRFPGEEQSSHMDKKELKRLARAGVKN